MKMASWVSQERDPYGTHAGNRERNEIPYARMNYLFRELAMQAGQGDWSVVQWRVFVTRFDDYLKLQTY